MHSRLSVCIGLSGALLISCNMALAVSMVANETFEYFMLSHEWPYSFCTTNQCQDTNKLQPLFNIHGLWPEKVSGSCHGQFNVSELLPIKAELEAAWMDLKNPNLEPTEFWTHEYSKHGSCASVDSRYADTFLYFNAALELHKNYTLTAMLSQAGIVPGPDPIKASSIQAALASSFGHQPELSCVSYQGTTFLFELRLCFEKDLTPRDCPSSQQSLTPLSRSGDLKFVMIKSASDSLTNDDKMPGDLEQRPSLRADLCSLDADVLLPAKVGP